MNSLLFASVMSDPAFDFLRAALNPETASPILSRSLGRRVEVIDLRVTRHKVGRRCLVEFDVSEADGRTASVVGKVRVKGTNIAAFELLQELWSRGFNDAAEDGIHVPQPLALIPALRMILLRKEPGSPAGELLTGEHGSNVARRMAEVAFKLHAGRFTAKKTHQLADELQILADRLKQAAAIRPHWSERIAAVLAGCQELARKLPVANPTGIHRDFYPGQVLIDGRCCCLVDLDLFSLGDPALDIGNFIGHLSELALRRHGSTDLFCDREEALIEGYLQLSPATSRAAIEIYRLLTLARHIFISTQFPDRQHATERLLGNCEQELQGTRIR
jgi:phosphotransferase family enzyme